MILIVCLSFKQAKPQAAGGFEQLYYMKAQEGAAMVPMAHYTTKNNWYGEARYNYDDDRTFSLYAGKTFSRTGNISYSATPLIGGLLGRMNGGSVGMNMGADLDNLFFTSQMQYTFSLQEHSNRYFFTWSELGYQATPWLYGGMALQQTQGFQQTVALEPGCMLGFSVRNWTVPVYVFTQGGGDPYFVLGVNWSWENSKKSKLPISTLAVNGSMQDE